MDAETTLRLVKGATTPGGRISIALAFYVDRHTYGIKDDVRQVGIAAPIDEDMGAVAQAVLETVGDNTLLIRSKLNWLKGFLESVAPDAVHHVDEALRLLNGEDPN